MSKLSNVREMILNELRSGMYRENDILPSVRQLAKRFDTSVFSISRVLNQLADEGFVVTRRGAPTRVLNAAIPAEPLELRLPDVSELSIRKLKQLLFKKVFAADFQQRYPECSIHWEQISGTGARELVDSFVREKISFNSFHFTLLDSLIEEKCIAPLPERLLELHASLPEKFRQLGCPDKTPHALPFLASVSHFAMEKKLLYKVGWDPGAPFLKRGEFFELLHDMSRAAGKPILKLFHGYMLVMMMLCFWHQDYPDRRVAWSSPEMAEILKLFLKAIFDDRSISFSDPDEIVLPKEEFYDPRASVFLDSRLARTYATERAEDFEIVPFPDSDSGRRFIPLNGLAWAVNARHNFSQIRAAGNYIAEYEEHLRKRIDDPNYDIFTNQSIFRSFGNGSCNVPFGISKTHESFYRELFLNGEFEVSEADWEKDVAGEYVDRLLQLPKRNDPHVWLLAFANLN